MSSAFNSGTTTVHADKDSLHESTLVKQRTSRYKPMFFHVRRVQIGLGNLSQLSRKCLYVGNSIRVKGSKVT